MTERQFSNFVQSYSGYGMILPKSWDRYTVYRGAFDTGKYCWPENGHAVSPSSYFGILRGKTGFRFDFLTEAEWEYACRAGTTGRWCDNSSNPSNVAWSSSSFSGQVNAKEVGLKQPNAWGLYDMHGNVWELCLDKYLANLTGFTDGRINAYLQYDADRTTVNESLVIRGGNWKENSPWQNCKSSYRGKTTTNNSTGNIGFRVICYHGLDTWTPPAE